MMHQNEEFGYTENELCQALCLPYGNHAYQMTILLPREGKSINDILQGLTTQEWKYYQYMNTAIVDVKLPRFESNTDISLNDIMARLGMPKAFTENAEFPDFCNKPTYIGLMKQCARIKLNEQGTEAAAVTAIGMVNTSMPAEPRHVSFHANHPFLYVISEYSTGTIFFIGQYYGD
jgi:serpin B